MSSQRRSLPTLFRSRLGQMASHLSSSSAAGTSLADLPKSNVFTSKLPPDPAFETPESSHKAPRETLGPRMVKGALFTYVRPETVNGPELLGVSPVAMQDIGLKPGEEQTPQFKALVAGNEIWWSEEKGGIYPWAQCYGGEHLPISPSCEAQLANIPRVAIVSRHTEPKASQTDQLQWLMGRAARRWSK